MISRVLGVFREMVIARYFGAGLYTDAFYVAFRIPNLLRDLFAEGALSSAFVPTFIKELTDSGRERAWHLASLVINTLLLILGVITLLTYFAARWLVLLQAWGFARDPLKLELTIQMTRIMAPFLLFVALAAVLMGTLNALGSFFIPASAPAAFNVCCILAGIFLSPYMPYFGWDPIISMAIGSIVGGLFQFLVQVPSAARLGFQYRLAFDLHDPGLRRIGRLMLPAVIGLSATQVNITVDNQLASRFGDGPVSYLSYAFRLMQLPVGVFGAALATATLAAVSHHAAQGELQRLKETLTSSLRLAACLTFPATVGVLLFRHEIVRLIYERKAFLPQDTVQTSGVLFFYAFSMFSYSAVKILVPTFYALDDTKTPVRTSVVSIGFKVAVNFLLILPFGFFGLALATTLASWLNLFLLVRQINVRLGERWVLADLMVYLRIATGSSLMGGLSFLAFRAMAALLPPIGSGTLAFDLGVAIGVALVSLVPILRMMGVPEADTLLRLMRRLFARKAP